MNFFKITLLALFLSLQVLVSAQSQTAKEIYKDKDGKVLTEEEAKKIKSGTFSTMTMKLDNGDEIITLIPINESEIKAMFEKDEAWKKAKIGKVFPSFEEKTSGGKSISNKDLEGKISVFNFWFIACKPCVEEMPDLNKLVSKYAKEDVVFIAPSIDSKVNIQKFFEKHSFDYTVTTDARTFADKLEITGYPTHFVVDQKGIIRAVFVGGSDYVGNLLSQEIDKLLK